MSDIAKNKSLADKPIAFKIHMDGDYLCSCGCGEVLGVDKRTLHKRSKVTIDDVCCGVGITSSDNNSNNYRIFRKECWSSIHSSKSLEEIYSMYQPPVRIVE